MRRLALALAMLLAACGPRGEIGFAPPDAAVTQAATVRPIFVGTTRAVDPATGQPSRDRSEVLAFSRYDVSIPAVREPGQIQWPRRGAVPDPARDFATVDAAAYADAAAFRRAVGAALPRGGAGNREVLVFVHGFNNTFAEGLYRYAQIVHDLEVPALAVHYAWPSVANALGYVHDRDSALIARDGLEQLLRELRAAGASRIAIAAHSMGASLTMETLRQIAIRGDRATLTRISGVILLSPDIDVDVFRAQARAIGPLPQPFVVFTSRRDPALRLSATLVGEPERLGNLRDVSRVADLNVTLLEVGDFRDGEGHLAAVTSPSLIRMLSRISEAEGAIEADRMARTGLLPGVVLTMQNATRIVLSPVLAAAGPRGR